MKLKTVPPDRKWVSLARERGFTLHTGDRKHLPLKKLLLDIGGWSVCIPHVESDFSKLITRGRRFPGKSKTMRGHDCQCHSNVANLYENNEDFQICTGYALTRDGMWRQHSWGLFHNTVIETTVKRISYFGFILTEDEAGQFCFWNI